MAADILPALFVSHGSPTHALEPGAVGAAWSALAQALPRPRASKVVRNPNDPATWGKVARNAPCPCDSGKKFKHCHGKV